MSVVKIREYQKLPHKGEYSQEEKESLEVLKNSEFVKQDDLLFEKLKEKGILFLTYAGTAKKRTLQAQSSIGIAKFTHFTVQIGPKFVEIQKIVELIEYVNDLDLEIFPESETKVTTESDLLSEIIISSFLHNVHVLLQQGMAKSYNLQEDNLYALRGKLQIYQQLQNNFTGKLQFACEYDELEYNNLENQIIRYCLEVCSNLTINQIRKQKIDQLIQTMSEHVDYKEINKSDFDKINYNQINYHYKKIHEDCKLIIDNIRILDFYNLGSKNSVYSFFVDMNSIFEKFVFNLFKEALPHRCSKKSSEGYRSKINNHKRNIEPDILIKDKKHKELEMILDTKYKDGSIKREDLYQLTTYAIIKQKNDVYAILPETKDSKNDDFQVKNSNIVVHVRHINIDQALKVIHSNKIEKRQKAVRTFLEKIIPIDELSDYD